MCGAELRTHRQLEPNILDFLFMDPAWIYFIYEIFGDVIKLSLEFYHHITTLFVVSNLDAIGPVVVSKFERFELSTALVLRCRACRIVKCITECWPSWLRQQASSKGHQICHPRGVTSQTTWIFLIQDPAWRSPKMCFLFILSLKRTCGTNYKERVSDWQWTRCSSIWGHVVSLMTDHAAFISLRTVS